MLTTAQPISQEVDDFVRQLDAAIIKATEDVEKAGLELDQVTLEIQTALTKGVSTGFSIKIVDISGAARKETRNTVTITFKPQKKDLRGVSIDKELVNGIKTIQAAVAALAPRYALSSAQVEIGIIKTVEGSIRIIVGAEVRKENGHKATLTFKKIGNK